MVEPGVSTPPGVRLTVQFPAGRPESATLPVATEQVGGVTWPITGAPGGTGCTIIVTLPDEGDVHPSEFVTLNVYVVPAKRALMIIVGVLPVNVIPAGLLVIVQLGEGNPLNSTEPVDIVQVGWTGVPIPGAAGTANMVTDVVTGTVGQPPDAGIV